MGKREVKIEKKRTTNALYPKSNWKYSCYTFSVNWQVIITYGVKLSFMLDNYTLTEQNIYGASCIGIRRKGVH